MDTIRTLSNGSREGLTQAMTVWCGYRTFEFRHLLSILSTIQFAKPDIFYFYYDTFPKSDEYNQWIQYVIVHYPFFRFIANKNFCKDKAVDDIYVRRVLTKYHKHGIYVSSDIFIALDNDYNTKENLQAFHKNNKLQIFKYTSKQLPFDIACGGVTHITDSVDTEVKCFDFKTTRYFIPENIWDCQSELCDSIRYNVYNQKQPVKHQRNNFIVIPKIIHFVYYKQKTMPFYFYMSVLSFLYIGNFTDIYIHCDQNIAGFHWSNLMKDPIARQKVHLVYRHNAQSVYGQSVRNIPHSADTGKIDVLYKYGGIVVDPDAMMIKNIDEEMFYYNAIMAYDILQREPFAIHLNLGIMMARPQSTFTKIFRESMRKHFDGMWLWNAGQVPYKILEYNPYLATISTKLQFLVAEDKYDISKWTNVDLKHEISSLEGYQQMVSCIHYTYPNPYENMSSLLVQEGITGEVGRYILRQAGLLI